MSAPTLDTTFGALLLGCLVSVILYGVSVVQYLHYYTYHRGDVWFFRLLVAVTFLFDTVGLALVIHSAYWHLVTNFFNPSTLFLLNWTVKLSVLFHVFTATAVQSIYTVRIWRLSRSYLLTGVIIVLVVVAHAIGDAWVITCWPLPEIKDLAETKMKNLTIGTNVLQAAVDTFLAISLCTLLHKSRTGIKQTDALINKLIIFFVNTGLLTSVLAIAVVISSLASPDTQYFAACYFVIGRLYTNSLLALLNSRNSSYQNANHLHISIPLELSKGSEPSTIVPPTSVPGVKDQPDAKTERNPYSDSHESVHQIK